MVDRFNKCIPVDMNTLFFAFRYAVGRKSAAPGIVMENILENIDYVDDYSIVQMLEEIMEERSFRNNQLNEWVDFEEILIQVLEKREGNNNNNDDA